MSQKTQKFSNLFANSNPYYHPWNNIPWIFSGILEHRKLVTIEIQHFSSFSLQKWAVKQPKRKNNDLKSAWYLQKLCYMISVVFVSPSIRKKSSLWIINDLFFSRISKMDCFLGKILTNALFLLKTYLDLPFYWWQMIDEMRHW